MLLHPSGALCLPDVATLLVADAHFGKAVSFRRWGVPVPEGTTRAALDELDQALADTGARRIVFLGDFLHSARAQASATVSALLDWRRSCAALDIALVRGNHDDRAGDPPAALGIEVVDEPWRLNTAHQTFALCHHPQVVPGAYALAGHLHPCVRLTGRGADRLRLPCFWFGHPTNRPVGVLPAFGQFTGMHPVQPGPGDAVYPIADQQVRLLPAPGSR